MPDLPQLCSLRHCWCWEPRNRPAVPVWSHAKMPSSRWSPAENARMFCVFMRPWTLQPEEATVDNPLLWNLGRMVNTEQKCAWLSCPAAIPQPPDSVQASTKRRRLSQKSPPVEELPAGHKHCYATSWDVYIRGHIVSNTARQFIVNMLSVTTTSAFENPDESSDDSETERWANRTSGPIGDLALVTKTLEGIAATAVDEGARGFGRHAQVIRLLGSNKLISNHYVNYGW